MSKHVKSNLGTLSSVAAIKNKDKRIDTMKSLFSPSMYMALHEIAHNIHAEKLKLNKRDAQRLHPHRNTIRDLAQDPKPEKIKRELVAQTGGFMQLLIPLVVSALASQL
jgi:hypothetical protein